MSEGTEEELLEECRIEAGLLGWPMAVRGTLERHFFRVTVIELYLEDRIGGKLTSKELNLLKFIGGTMVRDWSETKKYWLLQSSLKDSKRTTKPPFSIVAELSGLRDGSMERLIKFHDFGPFTTKRRKLFYEALNDFWDLVIAHYELADFNGKPLKKDDSP